MKILITNILRTISRPVTQEYLYAFFIYILGCICILTTEENVYMGNYSKLFGELFLDTYTLCFFIYLLPKRIKPFLKILIATILYLIAVIDVFCFLRLGSTISPTLVQLVNETNKGEAREFFTTYIDYSIVWSSIGFICLLALGHLVIHFYQKRIYLNKRCKPVSKNVVIILFCAIVIGIACSYKNKQFAFHTFQLSNVSQIENYFGTEFWAKRAFYLPIYRLVLAIHTNSLASKASKELIDLSKNIKIAQCDFTSPNIVLIVGESYNKHHSQLYGYKYPTTPCQEERIKRGEMVVFTDVITPFNITSDAFKNIFSLNSISAHESWNEKPLFTQIFKKSGYHVSFITNQYIEKEQKGFADFSGSVFLNLPELSESQFNSRNSSSHQYDEGLLSDYKSLQKQYSSEGNLIIFHLIGQHVNYKDRYPAKYNRFKPSDYTQNSLSDKQKSIIAEYDNATLYNDTIVDCIIKLFEDKDAIIIYLADHGEECYDNLLLFGRTHGEITKTIAKNEFEIPFWIWLSDKYKEKHPNICEQVLSSNRLPATSDDLPHLLLYLGGIKCDYYQSKHNILSHDYDTTQIRLIRNTVCYDNLVKNERR